jgi:hypothetical protein
MTHLNQDRLKAMLPKLDDRKICTSAPKDNLMMLTGYNMLPSIKMPMQKTAISRMLARNAHIPWEHHLNPPQQPRIAKYKILHKGSHKG